MNTAAAQPAPGLPMATRPWLRGPLVPVAIAWLAIVVLLWSTFVDMWRVWGASGTFAHGYAIFPISIFLLWRRRSRWLDARLEPIRSGILAVAAAAVLWVLGSLLHLNVLMQFAAVAMLVASVAAIAGLAVFRACLFPLLFMLFAVPVGEELVPWLMDFTASFTVAALDAVGIPVYAEGRLIHIPSGNFSVEKACSGIRYLIASVVLGTLFAHLYYRSTWRRVLFVALAAIVPILANGLRAFLIVILAHVSDNRIAVGVDHLIYGWIFFGVVMLLVFWIGSRFAEPARVAPAPAPAAPVNDTPPVAAPGRKPGAAPWITVAILLLPVALGRYALAALEGDDTPARSAVADLPRVAAPIEGWTGPITLSPQWQPAFQSPTRSVSATYLHGVQPVDVALITYERERAGAELVNSENRLFDPERWTWLGERRFALALPRGGEIPVFEVRVREGLTQRVIWQTFVVAGQPVADGMQAKLERARAILRGDDGAGTALLVSAAQAGQQAAPEREVHEFLVNYYTPLLACLGDDGRSSTACVPAP